MIPMVDLTAQYDDGLRAEIERGWSEALDQTRFIMGPNVEALESEIADYLGVRHAISCASGTDALELALVAAGVGPGDEVITSPFTFIATAEAICHVGATPVFVDIDPVTFNIDLALAEAAITPRTRAILPVHLFGQPIDATACQALSCHHGLMMIEDCAQSFGARWQGGQTGSFGIAGCFSFFPSKNLGGYGDGGLISTNCPDHAERLRMLRNHGSRERYYHDLLGYNSRLDEIQAIVLRAKLRRIDGYNAGRQAVAAAYADGLGGLPGITVPSVIDGAEHVYHQYTVLIDPAVAGCDRDAVMRALAAAGSASAVYYPVPLHQQAVFSGSHGTQRLPVTETAAAQCLSLPMYPELPQADQQRVIAAVRDCLR